MAENFVSITGKLPSGCLVYKDVNPAANPDQIKIRTFKGKDEKIIAEISSDNFEKKFLDVLRNVMIGIDPAKLTLGDRMYLALWETINSYSKDFTVEHECEHCWRKSTYAVDLSQIDSVALPETYKEPYEVKLIKSGTTVNLRLLRLEDIIKVDEMVKSGQNVWLHRYAMSIVNDKSLADNIEYLENLDTKDLMVIRVFHDKFVHGPKMERAYECPKCGGAGTMPVPFRLEMLLPFGKELERHIGDAI